MSQLTAPVGERDHIQGPTSAPVTLVEYGDYECSYCREVYAVVNTALRKMGDRFRFVFRNFPLTSKHRHAQLAAEAAEAAGVQGSFWKMYRTLHEAEGLELRHLLGYAKEIGLDVERFRKDLETRAMTPRVQEDIVAAARSGVTGTPTFFINGVRHEAGFFDASSLMAALKQSEGPSGSHPSG